MIHSAFSRTRQKLLSFTLVLVVFLFVADSLIYLHQSQILYREVTTYTRHEFDLFNQLVVESLTKGDYATVEFAASNWAMEREDILELKISTENGFVLSSFERPSTNKITRKFQGILKYGVDHSADIMVIKDMSAIHDELDKLLLQLLFSSTALMTLLGYTLHRTAIIPLQEEINQHKKTEAELRYRSSKLRQTNKELESFSYTLSHDIRTPLRTITSFSQILQQDAEKRLDPAGMEHLNRIISAGKYLAKLIDDILELSRISKVKLEVETVNLSQIAHEIVERVFQSEDKDKFEYNIQDGLTVKGNRKMLSILLEHLFENAHKFSQHTERPCIEFKKLFDQHEIIYVVKDNGVGFDMRFADKLFKPFQRLHQTPEYPGTGIGLSTVSRIIQRHGGRVWATSEIGKGSSFFFTLPVSATSQMQ